MCATHDTVPCDLWVKQDKTHTKARSISLVTHNKSMAALYTHQRISVFCQQSWLIKLISVI